MEPLGLGTFLEGHVDRAPHPAKELHEGVFLCGKHATRDHPPVLLPNRGHRRRLMNIEADVLRATFHESRSLLGSNGHRRLDGTPGRGRALNIRSDSLER